MTFFDLRLSFARNEVHPQMYKRFAAKGGDTLDKKCGDGHGHHRVLPPRSDTRGQNAVKTRSNTLPDMTDLSGGILR